MSKVLKSDKHTQEHSFDNKVEKVGVFFVLVIM